MITLIMGKKGSGKTKKLIELANGAVENSKGNVVVIEKGKKLTYDITHKARLIDTDQYGITGFDSFYGFVCGICAGNYDVTDVLIDSTLKIGGQDLNKLTEFISKTKELAEKSDTKFVISISAHVEEIDPSIKEMCTVL